MPYITQAKRRSLSFGETAPQNPGELNYAITMKIRSYLNTKDLNYQTINDIVGALEGAKAEFQRQVVNLYEDRKIEENGGIY